MSHAIQATWHDFHGRLREIAAADCRLEIKRKHYWRVTRTHSWMGIELRELAGPRKLQCLPREEVPFQLANWLARLSSCHVSLLTKSTFQAEICRCWRSGLDHFAPVAAVRVTSAADKARAQCTVDQCTLRIRCVLTLRMKGHPLAHTARLLRLSAWDAYSAWREGARQISKILAEHNLRNDLSLP